MDPRARAVPPGLRALTRSPAILTVARRAWPAAWPLLAMLTMGALLWWFLVAGHPHHSAIHYGAFNEPPLYGYWRPMVTSQVFVAVPAVVGVAVIGLALASVRRVPAWVAVLLLVALGVGLGAAVAETRPVAHIITERLGIGARTYWTADVRLVHQYGVRGFDARFPHLASVTRYHNTRTHPPGALVLIWFVQKAFRHDVLWETYALAVLGMLAAVPAYLIGRELGGDRAGRFAALLFVAAPGPLLLAYLSIDAVFATMLSGAAALFVVAIQRRSPRWAAAGGAALAVTAYFTYAFSFVAIAAVLAVVLAVRAPRTIAVLLLSAAAAGLVVLALERVILDYNLLACYRSAPNDNGGQNWDPYWIVGNAVAVGVYAGLPLAGIGVVGLVRRSPSAIYSVLPVALVVVMLVWGSLPASVTKLRNGEVERTWSFLYPVLAGVAGPFVAQWVESRRWWVTRGLTVLLVVATSVAQGIAVHVLLTIFKLH